MAFIDETGSVFGMLRVESRAHSNTNFGAIRWNCICGCGERRVIAGTSLRAGRHKSCGCSSPRFTSETFKTHGDSSSRTYGIFKGMHARCSENASGKERRLYFLRGIKVCGEWSDYSMFLRHMGRAPDGKSIDRIDGEKGYFPGNCRWATPKEQANNMRTNRHITMNGKTQTVAMWANELGLKANTVVYRLRRGCDPIASLTAPLHKGVRVTRIANQRETT